jgi:hypothetical protein
MANFPTLTRVPVYPLGETGEDSVIRSSSEAGYETTRPRFTKNRKTFKLSYEGLVSSDKIALNTFYDTTCGSGSAIFTWIHPETSTSYNVRFTKPLEFSLVALGFYSVDIELKVV